ncbi:diacylglycerol lipase-beta [Nomia melanderi]|uniref:diacylglycerol lipase-beta n=1 Tax=Nomia melanderi TaxID=2448451 RepID=UPI0013043F03|nr:sn1-specific diacylglycerol lipase beta-like [Nomia melanderi]XP_031847281.1 sn1-specific diacylglycerol lipase beta-like [Nomia melanderi]XP_031847282.1 sn1-specific diacylglycerol lipase beta-like [Nomia melanderi]XP_031847283.1 sn1-specific diacylglycerol lipase beta-like [Nomia melanderi]XP_031847284.1 sn1-specific diacylglycerol lipase beta-like [Nomia melanderi]
MPAINLFGRKWLAATDDLVYPGLFEIFVRTVWLILIGVACGRYYQYTWGCQSGGELVRVFFLGQLVYLALSILFMAIIVRHSAKGSIMDTRARKYVQPLLTVKILFILPEIGWNLLGSIWIFGGSIKCSYDHYTVAIVQSLVLFDWIFIGLTIFGLVLIFDPLGSIEKKKLENLAEYSKVSNNWLRRLKLLWWIRKDENAKETFQHVAALLNHLSRATDLVPSDIMAGLILLRVYQKRRLHESRSQNVLPRLTYTTDTSIIFANTPSWMNLQSAYYYLRLSTACYGWLYVFYKHTWTGCCHLLQNLTCCTCFRRKPTAIRGDNCCYCYLAGVKSLSNICVDDILYASFKNFLCEIPFCVVVDHKKNSIVIVIRGTISIRDIITDIYAASRNFECEGVPPGSAAHQGMIAAAREIFKQLKKNNVLEQAFITYPNHDLILTGHSLGAGIAVLLSFLLRPEYPNLKVFAFATPAGHLSRELAKMSEEFVLTVGIGDDFVMRLDVNSIIKLRNALLMAIRTCTLPKYRVISNSLGYMLFGIPEKDLTKSWCSCNVISKTAGELPLLNEQNEVTMEEGKKFERDLTIRKYVSQRLYPGGKILHLRKIKPETKQSEEKRKKESRKERKYEMRWAEADEFQDILVMPRMLWDHLPNTIEHALKVLVEEQNDLPQYID